MKLTPREVRKARIEIIPMIDTIFFLLVFFMVSSLSMVKMKGMNLVIPKTPSSSGASSSPASRPPTAILTVTGEGDYFVNTTRINAADLQSALRERVAQQPNTAVVLNLSKSQSTQTMIHVMDIVNAIRTPTGASVKVLIATEPVDLEGRALAPTAAATK